MKRMKILMMLSLGAVFFMPLVKEGRWQYNQPASQNFRTDFRSKPDSFVVDISEVDVGSFAQEVLTLVASDPEVNGMVSRLYLQARDRGLEEKSARYCALTSDRVVKLVSAKLDPAWGMAPCKLDPAERTSLIELVNQRIAENFRLTIWVPTSN